MFFKVPSNPDFSVDENGLVIWTSTGKIPIPFVDKDGYLRINYRGNHIAPHRCVAEVFCVNDNPEEFCVVNHLDGDKQNNHKKNLEWTTPKLNRAHSSIINQYPTGEDHPGSTLTENAVLKACQLMELGMKTSDITKATGIDRFNLNNIKLGKSWRHISINFSFVIPRKDTLSRSTLDWIKDQVLRGRTKEEIIKISSRLDLDKVSRAIEIFKLL